MEVSIPCINTVHIPQTLQLLYENLPSVLKTKCFNEKNIPFREEVVRTELGHLFEHMFLEYLSLEKLLSGHRSALFKGRTDWNWNEDARGVFHLKVTVPEEDLIFLSAALKKTITLFETILNSRLHLSDTPSSTYTTDDLPIVSSVVW